MLYAVVIARQFRIRFHIRFSPAVLQPGLWAILFGTIDSFLRNRIAFNIESLLRLRAEKRIYYIHPTTSTECLLGSLMTEKAIFIDGLPVHRHQPNLNSSGEKITRRVIHQIEHVDTFPAPIVDTSFAKTRLEVLKAWEINFSIIFLHISSLLAFIYICSSSSRIISAWNVSKKIPEPSFLDASLESSLNALSTFVPIAFIFLVISDLMMLCTPPLPSFIFYFLYIRIARSGFLDANFAQHTLSS